MGFFSDHMQIIFESQPDKRKSQPDDTKVSQLAGQKGYDDHPEGDKWIGDERFVSGRDECVCVNL